MAFELKVPDVEEGVPEEEFPFVMERGEPYVEDTIKEYIIVPVGDTLHKNAIVVQEYQCQWEDLREEAPSKLPKPVSDIYNVWEVIRAADKALYVSSEFLGSLYLAEGVGAVLTQFVPQALRGLFLFIPGCAPSPPPPPPPCPTTHALSGSSTRYMGFYKTRPAAIAAARAGVQPYAKVLAGLERNGFQCPNPACQTKTLGPVATTITSVSSSLSLIASFFWLEWRYEGRADFTWSATLTCS